MLEIIFRNGEVKNNKAKKQEVKMLKISFGNTNVVFEIEEVDDMQAIRICSAGVKEIRLDFSGGFGEQIIIEIDGGKANATAGIYEKEKGFVTYELFRDKVWAGSPIDITLEEFLLEERQLDLPICFKKDFGWEIDWAEVPD
jgi:hypothetical protein